MSAWATAGLPLAALAQLDVRRLADAEDDWPLVLDVRSPQEWAKGHVPGARHLFLPELPEALGALDPAQPVAVYCDTGYRASIGASWLQRAGFADVANVAGSWQAWTAADLPVEREQKG